jgi:hypothetical protein
VIRQELLSLILLTLAFFGFFALVSRLGRASLRLALNAAESTATSGLAEVSHRRGDITGFMENRASHQTLRRARRRTAALAAGYLLLLAIPPFAGIAREVYAASALLWLLPRGGPVRPARQVTEVVREAEP